MDGCKRGKSVLMCLESGVGRTNRGFSTCLLTMMAGSARIYMVIAGTSPSIVEKHDIWERTLVLKGLEIWITVFALRCYPGSLKKLYP